MDRLLKRRSNTYYYISIVYVITTLLIGLSIQNGLVIFLAWNMILATVVYGLSEILVYMYEKKVSLWILIVILFLWILFFPNSIYILTDFIHIQNYQFFESYPNFYHLSLTEWLVFMELVIGALYAAKLGIASIIKLEMILKRTIKRYYFMGLSILFILSSFGIFIGRFFRLNSWNIFDLFRQIGTIFSHGTFLLGFVAIFFVIHWVVYFIFSFNEQNIYNKNKDTLEEKI
ncbi:MAG: DUF1361 domain-containing protein [Acholeplasmataceae bacterium]|nr:DUF1361 domain-containing protein [Acholeplasmataceae bacterium]